MFCIELSAQSMGLWAYKSTKYVLHRFTVHHTNFTEVATTTLKCFMTIDNRTYFVSNYSLNLWMYGCMYGRINRSQLPSMTSSHDRAVFRGSLRLSHSIYYLTAGPVGIMARDQLIKLRGWNIRASLVIYDRLLQSVHGFMVDRWHCRD